MSQFLISLNLVRWASVLCYRQRIQALREVKGLPNNVHPNFKSRLLIQNHWLFFLLTFFGAIIYRQEKNGNAINVQPSEFSQTEHTCVTSCTNALLWPPPITNYSRESSHYADFCSIAEIHLLFCI